MQEGGGGRERERGEQTRISERDNQGTIIMYIIMLKLPHQLLYTCILIILRIKKWNNSVAC